MEGKKMIFGYWNIRGLGEAARMMFAYSGMEYEEKSYTLGDGTEEDRPEWKKDKFSLELAFPNLPYLIDGDVKLTESWAIYKYLGKKMGLMPTTDKETYECDMVAGVTNDLRLRMALLVYMPEMEKRLDETKQTELAKIKQLDQFLTGRQFVAGNNLTYVDFALCETLDHHRILYPDILDETPNVQGYVERFESLGHIAAYRKSDCYRKFPIFVKQAHWGGQDHDDRIW